MEHQNPNGVQQLVLGTAQLGLAYGVANQTGLMSDSDSLRFIDQAIDLGVNHFDTARAYGLAESRLGNALRGRALRVITKLAPLDPPHGASIRELARQSIQDSLSNLKRDQLDTVLLHRWEHHQNGQGEAWQTLLELKQAQKIHKLGASVAHPLQAIEAAQDPNIEVLQLPFHLLDWRWQNSDWLKIREKRSSSLEIHTRSAFFQGLLTGLPAVRWPEALQPAETWTQALESWTQKFDRKNAMDLCLAFVRSHPWVDRIVIGCDHLEHLRQNIELLKSPQLEQWQLEEIITFSQTIPDIALDPSQWSFKV